MSIWNDIFEIFSFQEPIITKVLLGTIILGFTCGIVGVLVVLSKKALIVDAVSHSILPGICIGFMISGVKNPVYLISGGMATGAGAVFLVDWFSRVSRIKKDAAIAITLSILFSLGVILLNLNSGNSNQSGLSDFLFGNTATIVKSDLYVFAVMCAIALAIIPVFYQHFKIALFDSGFAKTIGINEKVIQGLISGLIIISTAIGIQTVGIILMSALIITPASSSFFWTNNFKKSIILSGSFAAISGILGVLVSYLTEMPTGPWIVVILSIIAILSAFFSKKGLITKKLRAFRNERKMISDNVLKALYKLGERENQIEKGRTIKEILNNRAFANRDLTKGLKTLKGNGLIIEAGGIWTLTEKGITEAKRIIRSHRLWELYMEKFMQIQSDHVHESAETIEHIMTPELEAELLKVMGKPENDPHQQNIPYED